jgi:hypothetical protein
MGIKLGVCICHVSICFLKIKEKNSNLRKVDTRKLLEVYPNKLGEASF